MNDTEGRGEAREESKMLAVTGCMTQTEGTGPSDAEVVMSEVQRLMDDLHLPARGLRLDSDLFTEAGLDSLAVVELHDRLERVFRCSALGSGPRDRADSS